MIQKLTTFRGKENYFRALLREFEKAVRNHEEEGAHQPKQFADDKAWYKEAKAKLINYVVPKLNK